MSVQAVQIDIVAVSTSATLATMLGSPLRAGNKITLVPHATGIYMNDATATNSHHPMGTSSYLFKGGQDAYGALEFYAAGATNMTVIQEDDGEE